MYIIQSLLIRAPLLRWNSVTAAMLSFHCASSSSSSSIITCIRTHVKTFYFWRMLSRNFSSWRCFPVTAREVLWKYEIRFDMDAERVGAVAHRSRVRWERLARHYFATSPSLVVRYFCLFWHGTVYAHVDGRYIFQPTNPFTEPHGIFSSSARWFHTIQPTNHLPTSLRIPHPNYSSPSQRPSFDHSGLTFYSLHTAIIFHYFFAVSLWTQNVSVNLFLSVSGISTCGRLSWPALWSTCLGAR